MATPRTRNRNPFYHQQYELRPRLSLRVSDERPRVLIRSCSVTSDSDCESLRVFLSPEFQLQQSKPNSITQTAILLENFGTAVVVITIITTVTIAISAIIIIIVDRSLRGDSNDDALT